MVKRVVGLDIGETAIRAVELSDPARKPIVLRYHEVALPAGAVHSGEVLEPHTVATVLRRLWVEGKFRSKNVVLGVGNQKLLVRDLTVPRQPLNRIRESLPLHVQELIPVPVEDALLDFYPATEVEGEHGPAIAGLLVAVVKASVEANITAVRAAGLSPVNVDIIPFALQRSVGSLGTGTTALIDIGASTTNVVLVTGGVPQVVRIIPIGGDDITRALFSRLDVELGVAEQLKLQVGMDPSAASPEHQRVAEVIFEVASELLNNVRNTLNYFVGARQHSTLEGVILSGGGAQLRGFPAVLSEMTRTRVEFGDPFARVTLTRSAQEINGSSRKSAMTVALGLAMGSAS